MGFLDFAKGVIAQINPFDQGRTFGTYNPPQVRKKRPEDEQPQAPMFGSAPQAPTVQHPTNAFNNPTSKFAIPDLSPVNNQVPVVKNYDSLTLPATPPTSPVATGIMAKTLNSIAGGVARGGVGIGQAGTGLFDLLTPGSGTNRFSKSLSQEAKNIDTTVAKEGSYKPVYTGAQVVTNLLPLDAVNTGVQGVTKGLSYTKAAENLIKSPSVYRRVVGTIAKPSNLADSAAFTGGLAGQQASQGEQVTPGSVGSNFILGATIPGLVSGGAGLVKRGVTRLFGSRGASEVATEGINNATQVSQPKQITVTKNIPVSAVEEMPDAVNVRNVTQPKPLINEVAGDATYATPNAGIKNTADQAQAQAQLDKAFEAKKTAGSPDQRIEGVTPQNTSSFQLDTAAIKKTQDAVIQSYADMLKGLGEGNGVAINKATGTRISNNARTPDIKGKRMTKADWFDKAESDLKTGKAEPGHQQAFNDAANPDVQSLVTRGEQPDVSAGKPIAVQEAKSIPVTDKTALPLANTPEIPGQVRVTTQTEPQVAKTQQAINTMPASPAASVTPETQAILDNPKKYTKAQVVSARNQRKLAKQYSKVKQDTLDVINNTPDLAPKAEGSPGFVPTGEFRRGANNNVSEVAHGSAEAAQAAADTANLSAGDVLTKAQQEVAQSGLMTPESVRNLTSMIESGRFAQTSPEYRAIAKTLYGAGSDYGRGLSLFNPTMRRTASGDALTNRFVSKLYGVMEDGSRLSDGDVAMVNKAENDFTTTRDAANQALDRYNATKSPEDFNAWKSTQLAAENAEKESLITEYRVANRVLKGNKDPNALKAVQEAEKKAGVYQMDWIDSSMLSGTGTMTRNFINTSLVRMENAIFGRIGGGYKAAGARIGNELGNRSVISDFKARSELDQNKLSKFVKQWSTTGNQFGEGNIKAVGSARAYKFYEKQLKAQGVAGDQLKRDTEVLLHTDPDGMAQHYQEWSLRENALSSLYHSKKIEQQMVDSIASHGGGKLTQTAAKALVRLTVGFPTVIGRSLVGGAKRATLGLPDLASAGKAFARGDKQSAVDALYTAKVHAGSGAALYALGTVLANAGVISPSYPSDPAEQARWKAEGIQPNSIKIAGQWFGIPGFAGALALPLVIPANVMNANDPAGIGKGIVSAIGDLSPTAGIQNFIDGMEGRNGQQWIKNEVSSLTRALTPMGSFLNEVAKMTDPTKNDTTTKDAIHNILDSVAGGIPGLNNKVNTIPATDANGNILHNPNPVATFFGAQGSDQSQGITDTKNAQVAASGTLGELQQYGVFDNKNLAGLIDKKTLAQMGRGQALTEKQIEDVQKAVTKGIGTGLKADSDSNWRENSDYATDRTAMQVKLQMLQADPTTKKSEINNLKTQIARDNVLEQNQISYDDLSLYEKTDLTDWRKMGDPESKSYDPATYQKLWSLDELLTKANGSYASDPTKHKFSAKESGSGGGGRSRGGASAGMGGSFGTLKGFDSAPKAQEYATIRSQISPVPVINTVRPNIVHKITQSG